VSAAAAVAISGLVLEPGKPYVLRGLSTDPRNAKTTKIPPTVGRLVAVDTQGPIVQLFMGGWRKWSPKKRRVLPSNIVREATTRETVVGIPLSPLPKVQP
jgi:hypothetical protein